MHRHEDTHFGSDFITPPLNGAHMIRINVKDRASWEGSIQFDGNVLMLDEFGDIVGSTKRFYSPHKTSFEFLKTKDGMHLYEMKVEGYEGPSLRLVVNRTERSGHPGAARLLVLAESGKVERIVHLFPSGGAE
jgi:hypothetical protein